MVTVEFEGRRVDYDFNDLDELQLAYACSIHKAQGSEYPAVVIPVHTQHYTMLQRNLLYTGDHPRAAARGARRQPQGAVAGRDEHGDEATVFALEVAIAGQKLSESHTGQDQGRAKTTSR